MESLQRASIVSTRAAAPFNSSSSSTKQHRVWMKQQQQQQQNAIKTAAATTAATTATTATSISKSIENKRSSTHQDAAAAAEVDGFKGWLNDTLVEARLRVLQGTAMDRKEMHAIIGEQRDDWNKLFTATLRIATVSAAMLAAGAAASPLGAGVAAPLAGLLDSAAVVAMAAVSVFQPSQLAEEQRTASRLFGLLYDEIQTTLAVDPRMREHSVSYLQEKFSRLHALDVAFPLPLTPGGLPKFPSHVAPSRLVDSCHELHPMVKMCPLGEERNGWTWQLEEDLLRVSTLLRDVDVERYLQMARTIVHANKVLAIAAPAMAALAAAANFAQVAPLAAGALSVAAFFASCLSNDLQLGMVFEMYRNCAGHYSSVDSTIQRMLRMPVELREDGRLFHQRITHSIGRKDELPSVPEGASSAGTIF